MTSRLGSMIFGDGQTNTSVSALESFDDRFGSGPPLHSSSQLFPSAIARTSLLVPDRAVQERQLAETRQLLHDARHEAEQSVRAEPPTLSSMHRAQDPSVASALVTALKLKVRKLEFEVARQRGLRLDGLTMAELLVLEQEQANAVRLIRHEITARQRRGDA